MVNITKRRKLWFTISGIFVGLSVLAIIFFGFRLGLDFTGGARWTVNFHETTERPVVESFFGDLDLITQDPQIQTAESGDYLITIESLSDETLQQISDKMYEEVGGFDQISYRKVDSTIGQNFKKKAIYAIFMALVGIILFVALAIRSRSDYCLVP